MACIDHGMSGDKKGYSSKHYKNAQVGRHRLAYCEANSVSVESIKGKVIRHTCDNPRCINPEHLLLGTYQDNTNDMLSRGRQAKGENSGVFKLTEDNVRYIREYYIPRCREFGGAALGRKFGVHQSVVSRILNGTTWAYMERE